MKLTVLPEYWRPIYTRRKVLLLKLYIYLNQFTMNLFIRRYRSTGRALGVNLLQGPRLNFQERLENKGVSDFSRRQRE